MFLSIKVITSLLPPNEFGVYGVILATVGFFSYVLIGPIGLAINRFMSQWVAQGVLKHIYEKFFIYILIISVLTALVASFLSENFILSFSSIFCYMLTYTVAYTLIPNLNILGKEKQFFFLLNLNILIGIIFGYVLIKAFVPVYQYWLFGISLGNLVSALMAYAIYQKGVFKKAISVQSLNYRKYISFSSYILVSSIFTWGYLMGYRYIAESEIGYKSLGIYMACIMIATGIMSAYEQVVSGVYIAKFYREIDTKPNAWISYAKKMITTSVPVCAFVIATCEIISKNVLSAQYDGYFIVIQICAISEMFRVIISTLGYKYHGEKKTQITIAPSIILCTLSNVLIYLYVEIYGMIFIPIAMTIASIVVVALYIFFIGKEARSLVKHFFFYALLCLTFLYPFDLILNFYNFNNIYLDAIRLFYYSIVTGLIFLYALSK
jgi:O-antigen/teichoic acid export membrane protein